MINVNKISENLKLRENGIWYSEDISQISYPDDRSSVCFEMEHESFWYQHRNKCIEALISTFPPKSNAVIFDIGGGNGFVTKAISDMGYDVVLIEPGQDDVLNAQKRGISQIICSSLRNAKFHNEVIQSAGLFDVLEHIPNDMTFLQDIYELMSDGGRLYLTVPAYQLLWSGKDIAVGHYRRYKLNDLARKLENAGFQIDYKSYFFRALVLPIFLLKAIPFLLSGHSKKDRNDKSSIRSEHIIRNRFIGKIMNILIESEVKNISLSTYMSYGASCIIVASKKLHKRK